VAQNVHFFALLVFDQDHRPWLKAKSAKSVHFVPLLAPFLVKKCFAGHLLAKKGAKSDFVTFWPPFWPKGDVQSTFDQKEIKDLIRSVPDLFRSEKVNPRVYLFRSGQI